MSAGKADITAILQDSVTVSYKVKHGLLTNLRPPLSMYSKVLETYARENIHWRVGSIFFFFHNFYSLKCLPIVKEKNKLAHPSDGQLVRIKREDYGAREVDES